MAVAQDLPSLEDRAQYATRRELGRLRRRRQADRDPDRQGAPHPPRLGRDLADRQAGRGRDRGRALLRASRHRLHGHRSRPLPGRARRRRRAGRLDDHPAVRQERARGPEQPHGFPEAARGGAGVPHRAPVVQGQDPHRVPQRRLLRPGRLRHRGGRSHLLRLEPPRLRRGRRRALCLGAAARGGRDAGRDHLLARGLQPRRRPRGRLRAGATWCSRRCSSRASSPRSSTTTGSRAPVPTERQIQPPTEDSKAPFFTTWLRSQIVDYYGAGEAFAGGLQIQSTLDLEFQQAVRGNRQPQARGNRARPPQWSCSTTTPAAVRAMVGGSDYERARSTWRPTACASPAPPSSRSPWSPR